MRQLTAIDIVLADGSAVTADSTGPYSDLFWALRGGSGASFGVVTHFTANLFQMPTGSMFFLKLYCTVEVLNLWQTFFVTAPNELNAQFQMSGSDSWINGQYLGSKADLESLFQNAGILNMQSLIWSRFDSCSGINAKAYLIGGLNCQPSDLALLNTYPIEPSPKDETKAKTDNFNKLMPATVMTAVVNLLLADPNTNIYGHSLGGNGLFASQPPSATPFADRSAWYTLEYHYKNVAQGQYYPGSTSYVWLNTLSNLVAPYTSGYKYINYQDFDLPSNYGVLYWGAENFQTLIQIKSKYDPTNFFNNPQSIPLSYNFTSTAPTTETTAAPTGLFLFCLYRFG